MYRGIQAKASLYQNGLNNILATGKPQKRLSCHIPYWEIAVCALSTIGKIAVEERQGWHHYCKAQPRRINVVAISKQAAFSDCPHPWSKNVKSAVNGDCKHGKI